MTGTAGPWRQGPNECFRLCVPACTRHVVKRVTAFRSMPMGLGGREVHLPAAAVLQPFESMDISPADRRPENNILAMRVDKRPPHGP